MFTDIEKFTRSKLLQHFDTIKHGKHLNVSNFLLGKGQALGITVIDNNNRIFNAKPKKTE